MLNARFFTGTGRAIAVGLALLGTACSGGMFGSNAGRVRVVLSNGSTGGAPAMAADAAASQGNDDNHGPSAWSFQQANVTLSSILVRNLDGVLVPLDLALPISVDVVKIDGGREIQLPDGALPAGDYDQVVMVMTAVQGTAGDGTVITLEPPGGGWTAVIPICPLEVAEGSTETVGIALNVRSSFLRVGSHWSFQPRFRALRDCTPEA